MRLTEAGIRSAATVANRCSCEASLSRRLSETLNDWPVGADDGIPLSLTLSIEVTGLFRARYRASVAGSVAAGKDPSATRRPQGYPDWNLRVGREVHSAQTGSASIAIWSPHRRVCPNSADVLHPIPS